MKYCVPVLSCPAELQKKNEKMKKNEKNENKISEGEGNKKINTLIQVIRL